MAPLLALVAAVAVSQSPDFVDAEGSTGAAEQHVLAAGGWLYRSAKGGELQLVAGAGGAASSLTQCDANTVVIAGRRGLLRVVKGAQVESREAGGADLWDAASDGCADVVVVGDAGIWQLDVAAGAARAVKDIPAVPLYGVSVRSGWATAVGAKGTVLQRAVTRSGIGTGWKAIPTQTSATLLAVHARADGSIVVAGEGGLWRGDGRGLTQMWQDEREVFLRLAFADDEVGIAVGQNSVLVTWNGGRTWTRFDKSGWLAAAPVTKALFFLYGRDGAIERFEVREPPKGAVQPPRVAAAPQKPEVKPSPSNAAASPVKEPRPQLESVQAKPATAETPESCRQPIQLDGVRGPGFVDIERVSDGFILAGADGTVRRYRGEKMETLVKTGAPMLGVAADAKNVQLTVVGFGKLAHSINGGRRWRVEETPEGATIFAAAYAGRTLFVFDDRGRAHRRTDGGKWTSVTLPRRATFFSASFADDRRGYVVGQCGTLLATRDGGTTWAALPTPDDSLQGVLAVDDRLYVSSLSGVFQSDDGGDTWKRALKVRNCIRFAEHEGDVAIACGDLGQPLWLASRGSEAGFEKVQLDRVVHLLLATAFDTDGSLVAVGPSEIGVRAQGKQGLVAYDSEESRKGLARASWLWNELRKEERAKPASVVQGPAP